MKESKPINLGLKEAYDEMFSSQEERDDKKREKVMDIPLDELHPFKGHPFRVEFDEEMDALALSIHERGVISPCLARPRSEGGYELISGHRRKAVCEQLGLETMPVIIREMDDDTATITMVDSNQQRENLLPSEKAFAYSMKLEAMKRKAGRPKGNGGHVGHNSFGLKSRDILADESDESARNIQRYIRLTNLIPELLKLVDSGTIALTPAVELSYLPKESQEVLLDACEMEDCTPSLSQAVRLRRLEQSGGLTAAAIREIMRQPKANQRDKLIFRADTFAAFFPKNYTAEQMERDSLRILAQKRLETFERSHILLL